MRIALFGGTGKTGLIILKKSLEKGININTLARNPYKLKQFKGLIEIIEGDILDYDCVENTINGNDCVICVIGHVKSSRPDLQEIAIKNILSVMKKHNIKRLITLTGAGVFTEGDNPSCFDRLMSFLIKTISPSRFNDGVRMSEIIKKSKIEWTIVRAPIITNQKAKGKYKVYKNLQRGAIAFKISRYDLAEFILSNVYTKEFNQTMPVVTS